MDHMIGETVVAWPMLKYVSIAAGYNWLIFLSFFLSSWATYRLARLLGADRLGGLAAGMMFAFAPYRLANLDLLNQLQTQFIPLGLFFAVRYQQRGKTRDAIGLMLTIAAQTYFGWYYTFYLLLGAALLLAYGRMAGVLGKPNLGALGWLAMSLTVITMPVVLPYLQQAMHLSGFHRTLGENALYSADVLDYARQNATSPVARLLHLPTGTNAYCPGLLAVILATLEVTLLVKGAAAAWRLPGVSTMDRARTALAFAGVPGSMVALSGMAFVLSLGPILHLAGHVVRVPLPYLGMYFLPGFSSMRAPARLAVLVSLGISVLAGVGLSRLARIRTALGMGLVGAALILAGASTLIGRQPDLELPDASTVAPIYRWLAAQPDSVGPILELPTPASDRDEDATHALRQYAVLFHKKRRLDGVSGFVSPSYREFRRVVQRFPADTALNAIARLHGRLIIVHSTGSITEDSRLAQRIQASGRMKLQVRAGSATAYSLDR